MTESPLRKITKAICREQCAFMGEPPCLPSECRHGEICDEPGCEALARVAIEAASAHLAQQPSFGDGRWAARLLRGESE